MGRVWFRVVNLIGLIAVVLSAVTLAGSPPSCPELTAGNHPKRFPFEGLEELEVEASGPAFKALIAQQTANVESFAKTHGFQPLERHHRLTVPEALLPGSSCVVLDVEEPSSDGERGSVTVTTGFVERVAHHFVLEADEPRLPRHDGLVVVDSDGERILLDNSDSTDRVFVNSDERIEISDDSELPLEDLLKEPGWVQITPENLEILGEKGEGLVGKELAGYQTLQGGRNHGPRKFEIRGVIRSIVPFDKWKEWMGGHRFSVVTGPKPFIAVEIINFKGGTFEHPLSAPGKYFVRDLRKKVPTSF